MITDDPTPYFTTLDFATGDDLSLGTALRMKAMLDGYPLLKEHGTPAALAQVQARAIRRFRTEGGLTVNHVDLGAITRDVTRDSVGPTFGWYTTPRAETPTDEKLLETLYQTAGLCAEDEPASHQTTPDLYRCTRCQHVSPVPERCPACGEHREG